MLGASGYAGRELCSLLMAHPRFNLAFATAREQRGETMGVGAHRVEFVDGDKVDLSSAALIFSALPHGASREWVDRATAAGSRVVDLSADLRPGNGTHGIPYGLPEFDRTGIATAAVVANPGCYPTAILLALAPLVRAGLVAPGAQIVVNASSGVTGAGNSPRRGVSSMSAGSIWSGTIPIWRSKSSRRGEAEASTSFCIAVQLRRCSTQISVNRRRAVS